MLSVLITNTKGGCGKTTVATSLAGAFAKAGLATVLADCDRQKASLGWSRRRPTGAPPIAAVDWSKDRGSVPKRTQRLVIDGPAGIRRRYVEELVRMADIVVLPVLPSVFDEMATRRFLSALEKLKPVRKGKRRVAVVGNRVRARTRAAATLRDSQLYPAAALAGLSLFDMGTARAAGFAEDWRPLLSLVDRIAVELGR